MEYEIKIEVREEVLDAVEEINNLYDHPETGLGGYGHIVLEDSNIDTDSIYGCISDIEHKMLGHLYPEEVRILSLKALKSLLKISENERQLAIWLSESDRKYPNTPLKFKTYPNLWRYQQVLTASRCIT